MTYNLGAARCCARIEPAEAHFRALYDHSIDAILVARADGSIESANPAACELFGLSEEDLCSIGREGILDTGDPALEELLAERRRTGAARGEVRARRGDGSFFIAEISSVIFLDDAGEEHTSVTLRDVSSPRQAQQKLAANERLLRMTSQVARVGGWDIDLRTGLMTWSDEVCRIHGVAPGTSVAVEAGIACYAPEWRDRIRAVFGACVNKGVPYDEELQIINAAGERVWVRTIGHAIRDADGVICRVQGAFQDISERKKMEHELLQSRGRFRQFADAMPVSIWTAGADGVCDYMNKTFRRYVGIGSEASPVHWLDAVHEIDRPQVLTSWLQCALSGLPYLAQVRIHRAADRAARWHLVNAVAIQDGDGEVVKWVGTAIDVHDRKLAEEQVTRLAGNVLLKSAGGELAGKSMWQDQLRRSQRLEVLGQLTGGVAHDFNNLLMAILGSAHVLERQLAADGPLREAATIIERAAERGSRLTRKLLAFGRQQLLKPEVVDINELVADLAGLLRQTLSECVRLRIEPAADLWPAVIDASELEVALLNLCVNARDAMNGAGDLLVETANLHVDQADAQAPPGDYVAIAISDSGPGIAPEIMDRIFEPFFTTKDIGKGTGLGLSMVYGFIKQSGGHVDVRSAPGNGATFTLYIPRADRVRRAPAA